jgi:hypothetical protein
MIPRDENGDICTDNDLLVGRRGDELAIPMLGITAIDRQSALRFAAWVVALADDDNDFPEVLEAVRTT